ncbi:T9SS type A sorting domain-containing protein [Flagellimonas sp.]|uniref:T9SS type A sorting domain-containing protein n=1 Tax=Flagellimonas sp. TaxID=2058762 RepID=UPI003BB15B5C
MRKITFLTLLLACTFSFAHGNIDDFENDIEVVEILDETLETGIYYSKLNYQVPTKIVFPNLVLISSDIFFNETTNLVSIEFPKLERIEGDFYLGHNTDLTSIKLPELEHAETGLGFRWNPKLKLVSLPKLISCGILHFYQNMNLYEVNVPILAETAAPFYFHENQNLKEINASSLIFAHGKLHIYGHPFLEVLNLCNFNEVLPYGYQDPYFLISNNNEAIDNGNYCTNIEEEPEDEEEQPEEHLEEEDEHPEEEEERQEEQLEEQEREQGDDFEDPEDVEDSQDNPRVEGEGEEEEPVQVSVHPNPAEDIVQIDSEIAFDKIEIYDLSGNLIKSFRPNESGYDVSDVAAGMYVMIIYHKDSIYGTIKKLVIR